MHAGKARAADHQGSKPGHWALNGCACSSCRAQAATTGDQRCRNWHMICAHDHCARSRSADLHYRRLISLYFWRKRRAYRLECRADNAVRQRCGQTACVQLHAPAKPLRLYDRRGVNASPLVPFCDRRARRWEKQTSDSEDTRQRAAGVQGYLPTRLFTQDVLVTAELSPLPG